MNSPFYITVFLAGLAGFSICFYIIKKKRSNQLVACPLKGKCHQVMESKYSKFFGFPIELLGLLYYAALVIGYGIFLLVPGSASPTGIFPFLILTFLAFLFSFYLTFIQVFTLKELCSWCLMSAALCAVIFASALSASPEGIIELLRLNIELILILHLLGMAIGLGGATITDVFFFKFLKDFKISQDESDTLHTLSQVIWFGLGVLVLTGVGIYLPFASDFNESSKFLLKMIVVAVIIVNGAFLNLYLSPRLLRISFGEPHVHTPGELVNLNKAAFASGAISMVSWYSAFVLGVARSIPVGLKTGILIYLGLVLLAVVASQIAEKVVTRRAQGM